MPPPRSPGLRPSTTAWRRRSPTPADAESAAQAVVEGVLLARYRYAALKKESNGAGLAELVLVTPAGQAAAAGRGAERGRILADAAQLARDLANTPPGHLTASRMADVAIAVAAAIRARRRDLRR